MIPTSGQFKQAVVASITPPVPETGAAGGSCRPRSASWSSAIAAAHWPFTLTARVWFSSPALSAAALPPSCATAYFAPAVRDPPAVVELPTGWRRRPPTTSG